MEPSPGKIQAAADMPVRRPPVPQRVVTSPTPHPDDKNDETLAVPRKPKWKLIKGNGKLIAACALCAFVGSLLGSVFTSGMIQSRVDKSQNRQLLSQTLSNLIAIGADVRGDLTLGESADSYRFSRVDFSDVPYPAELRKAIRMSASLPGVTELNFRNVSKSKVSGSPADASVLAAVAEHFPVLDMLDVSCTNVSEFLALEGKTVRHLKIVNTPMILESFTSLKFVEGVAELSVGWPDREIPKDSILRTEGFRKALVDALSQMVRLKKVNLYDVTLDKDDREKLAKLEIKQGRLGD